MTRIIVSANISQQIYNIHTKTTHKTTYMSDEKQPIIAELCATYTTLITITVYIIFTNFKSIHRNYMNDLFVNKFTHMKMTKYVVL